MTRTVLVTDAGRTSAIAFIRSLGRKGWRVIAADADARSAGLRSRYAAERFVYTSPMVSPRAFQEDLHRFLGERPVDLVIPITDECIHPLVHQRARFEALTRLAIASDEALAVVTDKHKTLALARELGIAVPETRLVHTRAEARAVAGELRMPLVIKPAVSRLYLPEEDRIEVGAVNFAHDLEELDRGMLALEGRHDVLLQSYESGAGIGIACLAREGKVLRAFQHRRLAEIPVCGGASAWRESVRLDPVLFAQVERMIAAMAWTGLVMVEFKLGERAWLLEINGRVWGSLPLACLAGVDFPGELAELYFPGEGRDKDLSPGEGRDKDLSPGEGSDKLHGPGEGRDRKARLDGYRVGVRAYNFELMLSWITQVALGRSHHPFLPHPRRTRALAGLLGLLDPMQKSDLSDGLDLAPRVAEVGRIARKFAGKLGSVAGRNGSDA